MKPISLPAGLAAAAVFAAALCAGAAAQAASNTGHIKTTATTHASSQATHGFEYGGRQSSHGNAGFEYGGRVNRGFEYGGLHARSLIDFSRRHRRRHPHH